MKRQLAQPPPAIAPGSTAGAAISVSGVSKSFALPRHHAWTLKERMRHPIASFGHDHLQALNEVSFEVAQGEFFAVIGRNGSGKSTLLRCIAGIHQPDAGTVQVNGRVAPFIELGVGFHPHLAAADNVVVAGTLMGLRPPEARRRFPNVISFAELEEFVEMPIAKYSSGMQVRLAFSTSFQVDAEILLFDEVLAVGDEVFRRKCMATFERLIERGHTIVYVTHALETVTRFADRVLLLDSGRPVALGKPEQVLEEYKRRNQEYERARARMAPVDTASTLGDQDWELPHYTLAGDRRAPGREARVRRFADVTLTLARADFKLRYLDSVIGYLWSLGQPLLLYLVLYFVWSKLFRPSAHEPHYQLTLLLGIALFTFFGDATGHALASLVSKGTMLRKIPFPPIALPLSSVLTSMFVYGLTLVIVVGFIFVSGITPTVRWLEMLPALALLFVFTVGLALVLSLLYVGIRDVQPIWVVTTRLLFFLTPVYYPIEQAPGDLKRILMLNPLADVIVQARHTLIDPTAPSAASAAGPLPFAFAIAFSCVLLGAGVWMYHAKGRDAAERI
jgi:ABC-type polysaccharide/polyol phosphate transport system ATPase subunit/ABC-type polysaccharide/polyol phosphate export permease